AAAELALFDTTRQETRQTAAVKHLETALGHWKQYAAVATSQYRPQLLNRIGYVDLNALIAQVEADVDLAKHWQPGSLKEAPRKPANVDTPFKP
ncbi:MAG TPA: hypothetical protein VNT26_06835, partial [Candidatus Sulfotelmatobacter sp.]|nr:hypothetical protein [Candidatus Sulfotelmatobacter sp.]